MLDLVFFHSFKLSLRTKQLKYGILNQLNLYIRLLVMKWIFILSRFVFLLLLMQVFFLLTNIDNATSSQ
jgi:hypothetical protein